MDQPPRSTRPPSVVDPRSGAGRGSDVAGPRTGDTADEDQPSFLSMVGLVALVVAVVILVFFGIGYLFGRVFL